MSLKEGEEYGGIKEATTLKKNRNAKHHFYTNTYTNMSLKECEESGVLKESKKYVLKISGVWENKFSIGITYKFLETSEI